MRALTFYVVLVAALFALAAGSIVWSGDAQPSADGDTVIWGS
jgi:hypothetical protein